MDLNGNDALMIATSFGRVDHVNLWLNRFKTWDLKRKNKTTGAKRKAPGPPKGRSKQTKKSKKKGQTGRSSKIGKGLRHFSMKVCKKAEEKGRTTYNEVCACVLVFPHARGSLR